MTTVGVRELKANASALLERAEAGEAIVLSRRGRPVAVILPLELDLEAVIASNRAALETRRNEALEELARGESVEVRHLDRAIDADVRARH
jgi:prevent-host-death family protein